MKHGDFVKGQAAFPRTDSFEWVHGVLKGAPTRLDAWVETSTGELRSVRPATLEPLCTPLAQEPDPVQTVRARVLDEAKRITATDRNSSYGEPEDNFQRIADFWNVYLQDKLKEDAKITAGDTAAMAIMIKLAREMNAPTEDNKTDIAGYAACWAEVDDRG